MVKKFESKNLIVILIAPLMTFITAIFPQFSSFTYFVFFWSLIFSITLVLLLSFDCDVIDGLLLVLMLFYGPLIIFMISPVTHFLQLLFLFPYLILFKIVVSKLTNKSTEVKYRIYMNIFLDSCIYLLFFTLLWFNYSNMKIMCTHFNNIIAENNLTVINKFTC